MDKRDKLAVLAYWRAVEYLTPPTVPADGDEDVDTIKTGQALPWETGRWQDSADELHRHVIYFGVMPKGVVSDDLTRYLNIEHDDLIDVGDSGETALAAISVDSKGRFYGHSTMHSFGWAMGKASRVAKTGTFDLSGYAERMMALQMQITETLAGNAITQKEQLGERLMAFPPVIVLNGQERRLDEMTLRHQLSRLGIPTAPPVARPVDWEKLTALNTMALNFAGWRPRRPILDGIRIKTISVPVRRGRNLKEYYSEVAPDLIGSFLIPDIDRLITEVQHDRDPVILDAYLEGVPEAQRINITKRTDAMAALVAPAKTPAGRWPGGGHHPLMLAQQAAVNGARMIADASVDGSMFSVNGPPGTGKTTLLRDLIASLVVSRAEAMLALDDPRDGMVAGRAAPTDDDRLFGGADGIMSGSLTWYAPHDTLRGFEMVVASSNNGAVENVTREIPAADAIDASWYAETDYFREAARALTVDPPDRKAVEQGLLTDDDPLPDPTDQWGLMGAVLGNKNNRKTFVKRFLQNFRKKAGRKALAGRPSSFAMCLEEMDAPDWQTARQAFRDALATSRALLKKANGITTHDLSIPDPTAVQTLAPVGDRSLQDARARVFLRALDLHKAFILHNSSAIRHNLELLGGHLVGDEDDKLVQTPAAYPDLWSTLFLVVPVVSTTFASFPTLFSMLGKGSIGWVMVDEAGQAVPQALCGALLRARNITAIGDPLQIEPVVPMSSSILDGLRRWHGLHSQAWNPDKASVQTLADAANPIGSGMRVKDAAGAVRIQWMGCPLRVHRRCADPMFSIANETAYDGLMVHGGNPVPKPGPLGESRWINITARNARQHFLPAEGDQVLALLRTAIKHAGGAMPDVFVITPFKSAASEMRRMLARARFPNEWIKTHVGTVHTFQGKEAATVIFMLGGNPGRPGAIAWAASKPNLVNVAASRAKKTMIVIGDQRQWANMPFFDVMAKKLGVAPITGVANTDADTPKVKPKSAALAASLFLQP